MDIERMLHVWFKCLLVPCSVLGIMNFHEHLGNLPFFGQTMDTRKLEGIIVLVLREFLRLNPLLVVAIGFPVRIPLLPTDFSRCSMVVRKLWLGRAEIPSSDWCDSDGCGDRLDLRRCGYIYIYILLKAPTCAPRTLFPHRHPRPSLSRSLARLSLEVATQACVDFSRAWPELPRSTPTRLSVG